MGVFRYFLIKKTPERLFRHSATLSLLTTFAKQTPFRWPPAACLHNLTHCKKNPHQIGADSKKTKPTPGLEPAFHSQTSCLLFPGVFALCRRHPCRLFLPIRSALAPLLGSNSFCKKNPHQIGADSKKTKPTPGLEPSTYALRVRCSTR